MGGAKIARTAKQFEGKHFMTALVTGAAGFLGRYIVQQLLARGEQVTAFCRTVPANSDTLFGPSSANLKIVAGDIRDAVAVESAARVQTPCFTRRRSLVCGDRGGAIGRTTWSARSM